MNWNSGKTIILEDEEDETQNQNLEFQEENDYQFPQDHYQNEMGDEYGYYQNQDDFQDQNDFQDQDYEQNFQNQNVEYQETSQIYNDQAQHYSDEIMNQYHFRPIQQNDPDDDADQYIEEYLAEQNQNNTDNDEYDAVFDCNISIFSFNLWHNKENRDKRFEKLCNLIKLYNPDIICLQEISNLILQKMLKMEWCKEYFTSINKIESNRPCGEIILSKFPMENKEHFPFKHTAAGNYINITDIHIPLNYMHPLPGEEKLSGDKLTIVNTQFEKLKTFTEVRKDQFNSLISFLLHQENVFIVVDSNFTDEDNDTLSLPEPWRDAWLESGAPQDQQYTYHSEENKYINGYCKYRYDRVLYKTPYWKLSYFELIGKEELISTHFGIYTEFVKSQAY